MRKEVQKEEYPKVTDEMILLDETRSFDQPPVEISMKEIKETYPFFPAANREGRKLFVRYTLGTMTWRGDAYESAMPEKVEWCCSEAGLALRFGKTSVYPNVYKKVTYLGDPVSSCPFCGAGIEIEEVKN